MADDIEEPTYAVVKTGNGFVLCKMDEKGTFAPAVALFDCQGCSEAEAAAHITAEILTHGMGFKEFRIVMDEWLRRRVLQ